MYALYFGSSSSNITSWSSSNTNVATLNSTKLHVVGYGTTVITVTHTTGISQSITVKCKSPFQSAYYFRNPETTKFMQPDDNGDVHMEQHAFDGTNIQYWKLEHYSGIYFRIKNENTGLYLTAPADAADGDNVTQQTSNLSFLDRQLWKLTKGDNGYYKIQSKKYINTQLVLAVGSGLNVDGINIELRNYTNNADYRDEWELVGNCDITCVSIQDPSHTDDHAAYIPVSYTHLLLPTLSASVLL